MTSQNGSRLRFGMTVATLISVLTTAGGVGWYIRGFQAEMQAQFSMLRSDLASVKGSLASTARNSFDRPDMSIWCSVAERQNPDFDCPDPDHLPGRRRNGFETRRDR